MAASKRSWWRPLWRFSRVLLPFAILAVALFTLWDPIASWLHGDQIYDQAAVEEWVREARVFSTLPDLVRNYLDLIDRKKRIDADDELNEAGRRKKLDGVNSRLGQKRVEIFEHLKALGNPPTKIYPDQLPLFPTIYRLSVAFPDQDVPPITWDSELPRQVSQYRQLDNIAIDLPAQLVEKTGKRQNSSGATISVQYRLHAYSERQVQERQELGRRLRLSGLVVVVAALALVWVYISLRRERDRERQRLLAQQQAADAETNRLQEELRRQQAELRQEEVERQNLELRTQIFANIGIMAGSYAHNIKNLLVRPNDLLHRCLEEKMPAAEHDHLLREVSQTLGTVTERLQQILQTVHRDPGKTKKVRIDLNQLVEEMHRSWSELAAEKWKLRVGIDLWHESDAIKESPLWIEGDYSHLQQAMENLLFNARDATFEMRNLLRDRGRQQAHGNGASESFSRDAPAERGNENQRQALIAAAGWKGEVVLRTRRLDGKAILEVQDNGIGMSEEVRTRCTDTHFSTKRNNALFAGLSAGMGLGLAFVTIILSHHQGSLEILSLPLKGATFRLSIPLAS